MYYFQKQQRLNLLLSVTDTYDIMQEVFTNNTTSRQLCK